MTFLKVILFACGIFFESWYPKNNYTSVDLNEKNGILMNEKQMIDSYNNMTDLEEYPNVCDDYESESCAKAWIDKMDMIGKRNLNRLGNLFFRYSSDINKQNEIIKLKFQRQHLTIFLKMKQKLLKFKWQRFRSSQTKRIFKLMSPTRQSKNQTVSELLLNISSEITSIYNHAQPCHGYCLNKGESDIVELFRNERDYEKLAGFWVAWRNASGRKIKSLFLERMNLENLGARENGYADAASFKLNNDFEDENFNETVYRLYEEVMPLYKQLHAYVRHCLSKVYPNRFDKTGPIPAHIFGNLWSQDWSNLLPLIQKCQHRTFNYSIKNETNKRLKSMSVIEMFQIAEEFFTSIGMYKMTPRFWERSVVEQTPGKLIDCHGSAHDLRNGIDFRIKMCTKKTINDFTTIHHEMGHIEYYMAYSKLPYAFLGSANPGFHEAIGDTIALSVKTPEHLKKIGFISEIPSSKDFDMNYLLVTALEKVAFLPFALMMDSYVWSIYNGSVPHNKLNQHWWDLRYRFQGIKSPVQRTEDDFDAAAKYHIAFGYSYLPYFVSEILQFQFYESMCKLSGFIGPLHRCDFYQSKAAGSRFLEMLKKGRSQHWKDTLEILTETREISVKPLLQYFNPLYRWLKETNKRLQVPIGW